MKDEYVLGKWSDEEFADLKYMLENHFRVNEIAQVLGRKPNTVSTKMRYEGLNTSPREKDGLYLCWDCRTYKERSEFWSHKSKSNKYGVATSCKRCISEKKKEEYAQEKMQGLREKAGYVEKTKEEVHGSNEKRCTKCGQVKNINEFSWEKKFKVIHSRCTVCRREDARERKLKNILERGY